MIKENGLEKYKKGKGEHIKKKRRREALMKGSAGRGAGGVEIMEGKNLMR